MFGLVILAVFAWIASTGALLPLLFLAVVSKFSNFLKAITGKPQRFPGSRRGGGGFGGGGGG